MKCLPWLTQVEETRKTRLLSLLWLDRNDERAGRSSSNTWWSHCSITPGFKRKTFEINLSKVGRYISDYIQLNASLNARILQQKLFFKVKSLKCSTLFLPNLFILLHQVLAATCATPLFGNSAVIWFNCFSFGGIMLLILLWCQLHLFMYRTGQIKFCLSASAVIRWLTDKAALHLILTRPGIWNRY